MTTGPVDVAEVRSRLGGAPSATDEELAEALDVATAHVVPLLDTAAPDPTDPTGVAVIDYSDPATWPDDLHDGIVLAAVLTYRKRGEPYAGRRRGRRGPGGPPHSVGPVDPPPSGVLYQRRRLGAVAPCPPSTRNGRP